MIQYYLYGGMKMKIGYARVSTGLQNLDLQQDSLTNYGCEKIFTDKVNWIYNLV